MKNRMNIAAIAVAAASGMAFAGPVDVQFVGSGAFTAGKVYQGGGNLGNLAVGQLKHEIDGDLTYTFCIELDQTAGPGSGLASFSHESLTAGSAMNAVQADALNRLANATVSGFGNGSQTLGQVFFAAGAGNRASAAFQATIWEIVYDFSDFTSGASDNALLTGGDITFAPAFHGNSDFNAAFAAFRSAALDVNNSTAGSLSAIRSGDFQDQVLYSFAPNAIPTPAAAGMAGLSLGLLGVRRRR